MGIIIPDNHISIVTESDVFSICKPLFESSKITYFHYSRIYKNGLTFGLVTNSKWHKYVLENNYVPPQCELKSGIHLKRETNPSAAKAAQTHFNLNSFINLVKEKDQYIEVCGFASNMGNIIGYYIDNLSLLNKFVLYFKEKAHDLIDLSCSQAVLMEHYAKYFSNTRIIFDNSDKLSKALDLEKYHFGDKSKKEYVTFQELQCLRYLATGRSPKEIGQILKISHRTVETHINTMKQRFGLNYKHQLIALFEKNDLGDYFS